MEIQKPTCGKDELKLHAVTHIQNYTYKNISFQPLKILHEFHL